MNYIILRETQTHTVVLQVDTLQTFVLSNLDFARLKSYGNNFTKLRTNKPIVGLYAERNTYNIYIGGNPNCVFTGSFPTSNKRGMFYGYNIKLACLGVVGDYIVAVISCSVYCKYNIDLPLVMYQVVAFNMYNVRQSFLAAYTSKALFSTDESYLSSQMRSCGADFPTDCIVAYNDTKNISADTDLTLLGIRFGSNIPMGYDLCQSLNYL